MICSALILSSAVGLAAPPTQIASPAGGAQDDVRAAWHYRRAVAAPAGQAAFLAVPLPPELTTHCAADLRDLRLVGPDGREIAYVIDRLEQRDEVPQRWTARLIDTRREKKVESLFVVDLMQPRTFDAVSCEVSQRDFAKGLRLEASDDAQAWHLLKVDAGLFDRAWTPPVRQTTVELGAAVTARYLRLTVDDRRSAPIDITGVTAFATKRLAGSRWSRPVALTPLGAQNGRSRYHLDVPAGLVFDHLDLVAAEPAFSRRVRLNDTRQVNQAPVEVLLAEGVLYRLHLSEEALSGESLGFDLRRPLGGEITLEIEDGDSPPLRQPSVIVSGAQVRLLVAALDRPTALYYGNSATRAPNYDLAALQARMRLEPNLAMAEVGPEIENPSFAPPPPLAFATSQGAPLNPGQWRFVRQLQIAGRDDLYTVRLAAADLTLLRRDLGDVRIADSEGRQVPYILEPQTAEERIALALTRESAPRPSVTRYRLALPDDGALGQEAVLPMAALELDVAETFFSRPVALYAPSDNPRRDQRMLFAGALARTTAQASPEPLLLPLGNGTFAVLRLEIDEGDNAPLTLRQARAVVAVPRMAFKARAGAYRLLLGNAHAEPPRYDLATLRHEVLSYSALSVQAQPAAPNPAFRRGAGDYFRAAPPSAVLWGTIVAAVLALLYLTLRILKQPPDQSPPAA